MTDTATGSMPHYSRIKSLANARYYGAAFNELTSIQGRLSANQAAWGISLLCDAFDFTKAIHFFSKLDPKVRQHPAVMLECVLVLASACRFEEARNLLDTLLQSGHVKHVPVQKLVMAAPIARTDALKTLIAYAILNAERFSDSTLVHFLYELAKRRGLTVAADTLLEIHNSRHQADIQTQEDYLFQSNFAFGVGDYPLQSAMLSKVFESYGLVGTKLRDKTQPVCVTNLETTERPKSVTDGPLVSVIVAAYNAADTIRPACQSLFAQSYRNIEVIVVDDGSTDGTSEIARDLCEKEPRARVLSLGENYGLFTALNCGLSHSKGEYVTRQDADDWVHPERLRTLVSTLHERPDAIAAQTHLVRCSPQFGLESRHSGYAQQDNPSLIYRRQKVRLELGFYDPVRVNAGAEFQMRLRHVFGERSLLKLDTVAAVFNWSSDTLTGGGEFAVRGAFKKPARAAYIKSFLRWHEEQRHNGDLFIPFSSRKRRFPAPHSVLGRDASHF